MAKAFRCQFCFSVIGPYVEGQKDISCPDHPDGPVEVIEYDPAQIEVVPQTPQTGA